MLLPDSPLEIFEISILVQLSFEISSLHQRQLFETSCARRVPRNLGRGKVPLKPLDVLHAAFDEMIAREVSLRAIYFHEVRADAQHISKPYGQAQYLHFLSISIYYSMDLFLF